MEGGIKIGITGFMVGWYSTGYWSGDMDVSLIPEGFGMLFKG